MGIQISENPASYLKELRVWQRGNTQGIFQNCNLSPGLLCLLDSLAFIFVFWEPITNALTELANLFCLGLLSPPATSINFFISEGSVWLVYFLLCPCSLLFGSLNCFHLNTAIYFILDVWLSWKSKSPCGSRRPQRTKWFRTPQNQASTFLSPIPEGPSWLES